MGERIEELTRLAVEHGYLLILAWIFLDQVGLPIPAIPALMIVGAVAGRGQLELGTLLVAATAGAVPADLLWYESGRRRGHSVLRTLCRISLEPDSCVRSTEETFVRYGPPSLVVAKFLPGYQTLAPVLAGMSGVSVWRFLLFDVPGALLWSLSFIGLGYLLHDQLDWAFELAADLGAGLFGVVGLVLAGYVAWKLAYRQHVIRSLRTARIHPDELRTLIDACDPVTVVDLRSALEIELNPQRIPSAHVMTVEELDTRHHELPKDQEVVLYCT